MHLLAYLAYAIITLALGYAVKRYQLAHQKGLSEDPQDIPLAAVGTPIPVLFGTQRLRPIPVWDGGEELTPIKKGAVEIAKNHVETYQGILCWGEIAAIANIIFGDNPRLALSRLPDVYHHAQVNGPGDVTYTDTPAYSVSDFQPYIDFLHNGRSQHTVYLPDIFADFDGVGGDFEFFWGSGQPLPSAVMEAIVGVGNVPPTPDLAYVVFNKFRMGMDRSRPIDFVLTKGSSIPNPAGGLMPGRNIDGLLALGWRYWSHADMSIPAIMYEIMVDSRYMIAIDPTEIDANQFKDISDYTDGRGLLSGHLSHETTGMSMVLANGQTDAKDALDECLRTLGAVLRRHPETYQYQIKLIRDEAPDEDSFNALRVLDEHQIRKCKVSSREWAETFNEITIEWSDPTRMYAKNVVIARNDASIAELGYKPQTLKFRGVTDPDLAARIAVRELKAASYRIERQSWKMTREAWDLERGDVFRANYKKYGYTDRIVRVLSVNLGSAWSGEVSVETIDDVFSASGPAITVVMPPPEVHNQLPVVIANVTYSITTGYVDLQVNDPQNRIVSPFIEFQTQVGGAPPSAWTSVSSAPYQASVARSTADLSYIRWRYTYTDFAGNTVTSDVREAAFGLLGQTQIDWRAKVDDFSGQVTVQLDGISSPSGVQIQWFEVSIDDFVHFFHYDVITGRAVDPDDPYASNPPPWIQTGLGSAIGGPLTPGQEATIKIRVHVLQYDPQANTDIAFNLESSLPIKRSAGRTVTATWNFGAVGGGAVGAGQLCSLTLPFAGNGTKWKVQSLPAATARFDLWRNNGGHVMPDVGDSLGLSFGPTAHEIEEGVFGTPIAFAEGDNVIVDCLSNDVGEQFTVSITIENVQG